MPIIYCSKLAYSSKIDTQCISLTLVYSLEWFQKFQNEHGSFLSELEARTDAHHGITRSKYPVLSDHEYKCVFTGLAEGRYT